MAPAVPADVAALAQPDAVDACKLDAWYMDDSDADPRLPHQLSPPQPASPATLRALGVLSWHLPPGAPDTAARLAAIRAARGYTYTDSVAIRATSAPPAEYAAKLAMFYAEHMHSDEEIRYITGGAGYFDVRDGEGHAARWVRIATRAGDMIVLPAGMYHRFTPDASDDVAATRLFVGEPVWTPIAAGPVAEAHPARKGYLAALAEGRAPA